MSTEIKALQVLADQTKSLLSESQQIAVIRTHDEAEIAGELIKTWQSLGDNIRAVTVPFVKLAYTAWKGAKALENEHLQYPDSEPKRLKQLVSAWSTQELERARLAAAKQQAEIDRQHEEQRLAEAAQFEEAAQEAAFLGDAVGAAKMNALATQALAQAETPPKLVTPTTVMPSGFTGRTDWKWEVVDKAAIPLEYMIPDALTLNALVRSQKNRCAIPGIRVFSVQNLVNKR
jgi:hypothetical protein